MKLAKVSDRLFPAFPSFPSFSRMLTAGIVLFVLEKLELFQSIKSLDGDQLVISSELKKETGENETNYSRREFSYQSFQRSFTIPQGTVDGEKIMAKYADGILKITLPKKEEVKPKPAKRIDIM